MCVCVGVPLRMPTCDMYSGCAIVLQANSKGASSFVGQVETDQWDDEAETQTADGERKEKK